MSRKFLDDLRAEIIAQVPDNNIGLVTPAIVRGLMTDIVDSSSEDICILYRNGGTLAGRTFPVAPAALTNVFDSDYTAANMDGTAPQITAGTVTLGNVSGRQYKGLFAISVENPAAGTVELNCGLWRNGVPIVWVQGQATITNAGRPVTVNVPWYINKSVAGEILTPVAWTPTGAIALDITAVQFTCSILPTNNP